MSRGLIQNLQRKLNEPSEGILCIKELSTGHPQLILYNMPRILALAIGRIRQLKPAQKRFIPKLAIVPENIVRGII